MKKSITIFCLSVLACLFMYNGAASAGTIDGMKGVTPKLRQYLSGSETQTFALPLSAAFLVSTGVMGNDGTTAPGMATTDGVPAAVYASSGETTKMEWTFELPNNYADGLEFRVMLSSSAATSTGQSIDWQFYVNEDATAFDAAAISQAAVAPTSATLSTKNEMITLVLDATGIAALVAATPGTSVITVDIWNATTSDNTTEIKSIQGRYQIAK